MNRPIDNMPKVEPVPVNFHGLQWYMVLWTFITYRNRWRLTEDYIFLCPVTNCKCVVPKNFILDFASMPFFIRWIPALAKTGILIRNSVPHDFIYRHGFLFRVNGELGSGHRIFISRKIGDRIFREYGIQQTGAKMVNRIAYYILRVFGYFNYNPTPYDRDMYDK